MNEERAGEKRPARSGWSRTILIMALLLVAALAGLVWLAWPPKELTYAGRPLSYWLTRYEELGLASAGEKDPKALECREAIRHIGTNAIPILLHMLRANDSAVKSRLMFLVERFSPVDFRFSPAMRQNSKAVHGFWCLGELATNSIPALIEVCTNPPSRYSRECADSILKAIFPVSGADILYWVPSQKRAEWYHEAGQVRSQLGTESNAILAFSEAIKLDPTNAAIYLSRATSRIQVQDFAGALADATRTTELSSSNQAALYLCGFCRFELKDFKRAEADFTIAIDLYPNDGNAYNLRGLARANLRKLDDALADFNKAIELVPEDAAAYRNRALVQGLQKEYELALEDASRSIGLDATDAAAYLARGSIRNLLKDYASAVRDFNKAVELNPQNPAGYASRGATKMLMDDFESASIDLEKALQLDPTNVTAYVARGWLKAKRGGEDSRALVDFERAVELGAQAAETHAMLGLFQYKLSQWTPALASCRRALELDAVGVVNDSRFYIWLIRAQSGEEADANGELEVYLKSLPVAKADEWEASIARFLSGSLTESNFLTQATTTARRPSAVRGQVCESLYYAGMKRKISGDKQGALELFQKCVDTKEVNSFGYMNAVAEMRVSASK